MHLREAGSSPFYDAKKKFFFILLEKVTTSRVKNKTENFLCKNNKIRNEAIIALSDMCFEAVMKMKFMNFMKGES
jgi:hypothetical protein